MLKYTLALILIPTLLLSDALPETYRLFYRTDDDKTVIVTPDWQVSWTRGDWTGLSILDRIEARENTVQVAEDGPAPDLMVDFEPNIMLCDRLFAIVTFAYVPNMLRGTPNYSYLRIIFEPTKPDLSWQIWDVVAEERGFPYPAVDLGRAYSINCSGENVEVMPLK